MSATLDKLAYTTPEACRLLSIGPTTLYSLSKQGKLTPVKIGRATRWRRDGGIVNLLNTNELR